MVSGGSLNPIKVGGKLFFDLKQLPDEKAQEAFLKDRGLLSEAKAETEALNLLKPWQKNKMYERETLVREYLIAEQNIPQGKKVIFQEEFAKTHDINPKTLRRHLADYKKGGREALVPRWNSGRSNRVITKDMEKFIDSEFMQPLGPSIAEVYEKLIAKFRDKYPRLPSYRTVANYINKKWPKSQQMLIRDKEEWNRRYSPYVSRNWEQLEVDECWFSDAKQVDVACLYGRKIIFPWFTAFLDAASRKFVGGIMTPTPNADAIAQAFVYAARKHGIPNYVYIDRGKAYKSHRITGERIKEEEISLSKDFEDNRILGIFAEMGIEIIWASPYNAREKIIEPAFKIFTYRLRGLPGYRGHNTKTRPKKLNAEIKSGKLLTLEELSKKIDEVIHAYNARPHSATGRSPNSYYENLTPVIPSENLLSFLLMDVHKKRVGASRVTIDGLIYRHEDLFKIAGEQVEVRRDPRDIRQAAIIYKGKLFCIASVVTIGTYRDAITLENVKEARKQRRKIRQYREEIIKQGGYIEDPLKLAMHLKEQEKKSEPEIHPARAKVTSLHRKERLAKNVAQGLGKDPLEAEPQGRARIAELNKDNRRERILRGLLGK